MKSGSKAVLTIKWVFFVTLIVQCFSPSATKLSSFFANVTGTNAKVSAAVAAATPELPRVLLNTSYTPPGGRIITVNAGGDLQAAINQAAPGDIITLQAGATFTGNFTLPNKSGTGWVVIRSSSSDSSLPPQGTRVSPQNASLMPRIVTPNTDAAIKTAAGAHNYRLLGLEIGIQSGVTLNYGIVRLGEGSSVQNSLSQVPQDIIIDRCYIHGNSTGDVSRGIGLNSARTAIIDSFISECHAVGADAQAICGWNGPGPFKIVNNYLEGSGENFMLGGADPSISNLVPSDIEFRNNYVYKPLRWKAGESSYAGIHWSVKNLFELKNAMRLLIDGNTFENCWGDAQQGFAILMKSVNQEGTAPWSQTSDVTFTNNIIRHSGAGINLLGTDPSQPGIPMKRVLVRNNLWDDINDARWTSSGLFLQISNAPDVVVDHNTVLQTGSAITAYGPQSLNFVFTNNILNHGPYGVKGDGTATGNGTISSYFPGAVFSRNALVGGSSASYPTGNYFPTSLSAVGFTNLTGGDYRLVSTSPYCRVGTDGQDLGYLYGGTTPNPTPTATPTPTPTPALAITNVAAASITTSSATITWTTNQFADSQVEYGTTSAYGKITALNTTLLSSHVEVISGLVSDTVYSYRVKSKTSGGTLAVSSNFTFRTLAAKPSPTPTPTPTPTPPSGDTTPPTISNVSAVSVTTTGATVTWGTNEASDSQVEYGTTTSYGQATTLNTSRVTSHSTALANLKSGTTYNYRVKSRDAAGNLAVSGNFTFKTTTVSLGTPVTWTQLRGVTVSGSVLMKVSGCEGCRSSAISAQSITSGDGFVEFTAIESNRRRFVGLMLNNKTVTITGMDFSFEIANGEAAVFESGDYRTEVPYGPNDVFRIAIEGGVVRYYKNGVVFYTSFVKPVYPLVTAAWIDQLNGTVANAVMSAGSNIKIVTRR